MKYSVSIAVILLVAISAYFLYNTLHKDYTVVFENELASFENELQSSKQLIDGNQLTPGLATLARARLISSLDTMRNTLDLAEATKVSSSQEASLLNSLERLETSIHDHKETILTIEKTANPNFPEQDGSLGSVLDDLNTLVETLKSHIDTVSGT